MEIEYYKLEFHKTRRKKPKNPNQTKKKHEEGKQTEEIKRRRNKHEENQIKRRRIKHEENPDQMKKEETHEPRSL